MYSLAPFKFYVGYENIKFENPETALPVGFDVASYKLAIVNNAPFNEEKILQVYWAGVKYSVNPKLDLTAAYYGYHQSNFATTAATLGCTTNVAATCSGELVDFSVDAVYKLSKRFDVFGGVMYSGVQDGLATVISTARTTSTPPLGCASRSRLCLRQRSPHPLMVGGRWDSCGNLLAVTVMGIDTGR
jgi:predicted porin